MATPVRTKYTIPGTLGELLIDVRTADRRHPAPAVIVVHGFKGFKDWGMFPPFCERLARAGFTAVSLNLSGSGVDDDGEFSRAERFGRNTFSAEQRDLDLVLDALDDGTLGVPKPTSIAVVGHSRGGGAAILLAGRSERITALVTWAAIATVRRWTDESVRAWRARGSLDVVNSRTGQVLPLYTDVLDDIEAGADGPLDVVAAAGRVSVPWLLLHGTADETVPADEARRLAAARQPDAGGESVLIDGAGHTFGATHPFGGMSVALQEVFDRSVSFLSRTLT